MTTNDDDGWVDKSGAEGRVDETRRREETRRITEGADAKTTGVSVEKKMYTYEYSRWCARRRREGRDESWAKNRVTPPSNVCDLWREPRRTY